MTEKKPIKIPYTIREWGWQDYEGSETFYVGEAELLEALAEHKDVIGFLKPYLDDDYQFESEDGVEQKLSATEAWELILTLDQQSQAEIFQELAKLYALGQYPEKDGIYGETNTKQGGVCMGQSYSLEVGGEEVYIHYGG